jgi:gliding motility-associated lipoprotein GldD
MLRSIFSYTIIIAVMANMVACSSDMGIKRRGYFKINYPKGNYIVYDNNAPYKFEYPSYAIVERDSSFFDTTPENPYWLNISIPSLDAKLYISYKQIATSGKNSFDSLLYQTTTLSFKHSNKANSIDPKIFTTPKGQNGVFFDLSGDVATSKQFFITDSTKHFFRGALYFNAAPNNDSLRPIYEFLEKDLMHIANTLEWKN